MYHLQLSEDKLERFLVAGKLKPVIKHFFRQVSGHNLCPGVDISRHANACFHAALHVESTVSKTVDPDQLLGLLNSGERLLEMAIEDAPDWPEVVIAFARNLWFQGRFQESMQRFAQAESVRERMIDQAGWDRNEMVILPRNCAQIMGLMMGHLDAFIKHKILSGDKRPYYLVVPEIRSESATFLNYWRDHIHILSEPEEISKVIAKEPAFAVNWNWIFPQGNGYVHIHKGIADIQRRWRQAGKGPLLALKEAHSEILRQQRMAWGMKADDWFVCLQVRSAGFYSERPGTAQQFRNTPIEDYYPVIEAVVELGGWVVRMGDPAMPPLDFDAIGGASHRVIDYAHAPEKSPVLDIALCASCRLFLSSPSGLRTVARTFGRPVCVVNRAINAGIPWHPGDIFIPQLYYSREKNRTLTLEEILSTDLVHADHQFLLERAGVTLLKNDPQDIVETMREGLDPSAYEVANPQLADRTLDEFNRLNAKHDRGISGRLGRYYAMKHATELSGSAAATEVSRENSCFEDDDNL